jgi:hypothetical protein
MTKQYAECVYVFKFSQTWYKIEVSGDLHYSFAVLPGKYLLLRGPSQKKRTERSTYRIERQMCGKVL